MEIILQNQWLIAAFFIAALFGGVLAYFFGVERYKDEIKSQGESYANLEARLRSSDAAYDDLRKSSSEKIISLEDERASFLERIADLEKSLRSAELVYEALLKSTSDHITSLEDERTGLLERVEELRATISRNAASYDEQITEARRKGEMAEYALNAITTHSANKHEIVELVVAYVRDSMDGGYSEEPPFDQELPPSIDVLNKAIERSLRKRPGR